MIINGAPWVQQHAFNTQSGDLTGTWAAGTNLPGVRAYHCAVFIKGYVWLIGGLSALTTFRQNSYRGTVATTGIVTPWTTVSNFSFSRSHFDAVVIGPYVYAIGGYDGSASSSTILRATIDSAGTIGTFSAYAVSLPEGRSGHKCAVIKNKLYVFGGSSSANTAILVSNIDTAGDLGAFSSSGTVVPYPYQTLAVTSTKVYLIGGLDGITYPTSIQAAVINADGTLGTFAVERYLNEAIANSSAITTSGNIHLFGGREANTSYLSALNRLILSSGSISSQPWPNYYMLATRHGHTAVATSSRAYVFGGLTRTTFLNTTEYVAFTGGLNDYSGKLTIADPTNYELGSSVSAASTTSTLGYSVVASISLASSIPCVTGTSSPLGEVTKPLASSISVSTSTLSLTKVWCLSSSVACMSSTSSVGFAFLMTVQSACACSTLASAPSITKITGFQTSVGASSGTPSVRPQTQIPFSSSVVALSFMAPVLKSAIRSLLSSIPSQALTKTSVSEVRRILSAYSLGQSATSEVRAPISWPIQTDIQVFTWSSNVSRSSARSLASFLVGHVNVPEVSAQRTAPQTSNVKVSSNTKRVFIPSDLTLDSEVEYALKRIFRNLASQKKAPVKLVTVTVPVELAALPNFKLRKVTYGISI